MNDILAQGILEALQGIKESIDTQNEYLDRISNTLDDITTSSPKGTAYLNVAASIHEN